MRRGGGRGLAPNLTCKRRRMIRMQVRDFRTRDVRNMPSVKVSSKFLVQVNSCVLCPKRREQRKWLTLRGENRRRFRREVSQGSPGFQRWRGFPAPPHFF